MRIYIYIYIHIREARWWLQLEVRKTSNLHYTTALHTIRGRVVRPFLMVLHLYWSRPAQCLLVAHHGYWVPCGSRLNCAGSRSRLEPQRYSVHDPSACGYALALTNPITCCLAGRCLQAKARRRELRNQTTLSQLWVK